MYDNVSAVYLTDTVTGFVVSLRDQAKHTIVDDTGEKEEQYFLYKTPASKEAKRLAKAYGVKVVEN